MLRVDGDLHGLNASVYAARNQGQVKVAVFNKDENTPMQLAIRGDFQPRSGNLWRLQAPSLDSTQNVTLAGTQIEPTAQWNPRSVESIETRNGVLSVRVPASSAALLFLR